MVTTLSLNPVSEDNQVIEVVNSRNKVSDEHQSSQDEKENGEEVKVGIIDYVDESTINTLATLEDGRMVPLHEDFIVEINEDARELHVRFPFEL